MEKDPHIVDYEEVLRVLPESFRNSWKDNPDVLVYLSELGSLGLQRLSQEPEKLSEEKFSLLEQTQDLAFHNYKTFIHAAECSQKIFKDFTIIESRLGSLVEKLPDFKEKCGGFGKEAQKINARWRQASSTLAKHPQLLELLEMSQLMDSCVKNGYYDEALELSAYVKRLEKKHSDIPLMKSISEDVQASSNMMLSQLLLKLSTNIQLPECLKVVGYLKRMNVFNESELRIKFLQARDSWFQKVIHEIQTKDSYEHIIKVIESSRIYLFDITTQYRAIFSDDDPLLLVREESKGNCAIFYSWITWKMSWFLSVLEEDISGNLGGRIDSVLSQCMFFGLSFSRVNIDFRSLVIPIFENRALRKFFAAVGHATTAFEKIMETYAFSIYTSTTLFVTNPSEESLQPPINLLDFYPLAQYCNDVLNALNELKLCCTFSMAFKVVNAFGESLKRIAGILSKIYTRRKNTMTEVEMEHLKKFSLLFSSELLPHINKCLHVMFPPDKISQALGISVLEFQKFEKLCKVDNKVVQELLQDILPSKDDDVGLTITIKASEPEDEPTLSNKELNENKQDSVMIDKNVDIVNENNQGSVLTYKDAEIVNENNQDSIMTDKNSDLLNENNQDSIMTDENADIVNENSQDSTVIDKVQDFEQLNHDVEPDHNIEKILTGDSVEETVDPSSSLKELSDSTEADRK